MPKRCRPKQASLAFAAKKFEFAWAFEQPATKLQLVSYGYCPRGFTKTRHGQKQSVIRNAAGVIILAMLFRRVGDKACPREFGPAALGVARIGNCMVFRE